MNNHLDFVLVIIQRDHDPPRRIIVIYYNAWHNQKFEPSLFSQEEKKDFLFGNLLCISLDKEFKNPLWATVGQSPQKGEYRDYDTK